MPARNSPYHREKRAWIQLPVPEKRNRKRSCTFQCNAVTTTIVTHHIRPLLNSTGKSSLPETFLYCSTIPPRKARGTLPYTSVKRQQKWISQRPEPRNTFSTKKQFVLGHCQDNVILYRAFNFFFCQKVFYLPITLFLKHECATVMSSFIVLLKETI